MKPLPTDNEGYGFHGELWHVVTEYGQLTKKPGKGYSDDKDDQITAIWNAVSAAVAKHIAVDAADKAKATRNWLDGKSGRHLFDAMTRNGLPRFKEGERVKLNPADFVAAAERAIKAEKWIQKELANAKKTPWIMGESVAHDTREQRHEDYMDEITKAVFETTEDGELPFHGELVVEGDDGQPETLDEADVMEDVVIEAFEQEIANAVALAPNEHLAELREIDELLSEGDYEGAMDLGVLVLRKCGVAEARIDEFKKGFKTSATQRQRMGRMRKRAKTGGQLMALRKRRRAARKSSSRMKRARYYKTNKRRITRRRAQLQNSQTVDLDAKLVAEMAALGMRVVVLGEGSPVFVTSVEAAASLAEGMEGVTVVELTDEQIEEAKKKANPFAKKKADDEEDEDEADDSDEESDDEESDDEEGDDEDDEEETDESVEENQLDEQHAAGLANEIAKFLKQHPSVGYGELATRFKIGRDVAQQAIILAGRVAGSGKESGSWLTLAKEILGKLMNHAHQNSAPATSLSAHVPGGKRSQRVAQVASVQDDGANLSEEGDETDGDEVDEGSGAKAGCIRVSKQSLPKPKLKGKDGAIKSAHSTAESATDDDETEEVAEDQDPDAEIDEVADKNGGSQTHTMGKGKGAKPGPGPATLKKPAKLTAKESEDDPDAEGEGSELAEVTVPVAKAEALIAAAAQHGLDSKTKVRVQTKEGVVTMSVPARVADAIRKAIA